MIRVNEIKFDLDENFGDREIRKKLCQKLKIGEGDLLSYQIKRESIDARKGIVFSYTIDVNVGNEAALIKKGYKESPEAYVPSWKSLAKAGTSVPLREQLSPVIIGFGPAGMFAGLVLAEAGLKPIIVEQGGSVEERTVAVETFWNTGKLNPHSNVQFGEGGAGTFSDGKLTTRIKDPRIEYVLSTLIEAGAPEEIAYKQKPHIGTDILKTVVKNIRKRIIEFGGTIHFNTKAVELLLDEERAIKGVRCQSLNQMNGDVKGDLLETDSVILALGHSSRETFEHLVEINASMEAKPFAVGVRIEHPQIIINGSQYGKDHSHKRLGAADYKLTYQTADGRSVYSFCMCPGGTVVASASEDGRLVVNGMSEYARNENNANSALLVNVEPKDYGADSSAYGDVLKGMMFQRKLEERAYEAGGRNYSAPYTTVAKLCGGKGNKHKANKSYYERLGIDYDGVFNNLKPSYNPDVNEVDFEGIFPSWITNSIKEAIPSFGFKIKGFDDERAVLTAVESRSSSPIRILRDKETFQSVNITGLYPCGEGAGYAGGITSASVDGIKVAESIARKLGD